MINSLFTSGLIFLSLKEWTPFVYKIEILRRAWLKRKEYMRNYFTYMLSLGFDIYSLKSLDSEDRLPVFGFKSCLSIYHVCGH